MNDARVEGLSVLSEITRIPSSPFAPQHHPSNGRTEHTEAYTNVRSSNLLV
jgi:hypothetical protein